MNGKVVLVMALLIMFAVAPVMAAPAEKLPVSLTIASRNVKDSLPEKTWMTEGGINQTRGIIRTCAGTLENKWVTLNIDGTKIYGSIYAEVDLMNNTKTLQLINHYHKWIISFPAQSGYQTGAFEGTNIWVLEPLPGATPPVTVEGHAVLQGNGGFEGMTLKIATQFPPSMIWNGYLITR